MSTKYCNSKLPSTPVNTAPYFKLLILLVGITLVLATLIVNVLVVVSFTVKEVLFKPSLLLPVCKITTEPGFKSCAVLEIVNLFKEIALLAIISKLLEFASGIACAIILSSIPLGMDINVLPTLVTLDCPSNALTFNVSFTLTICVFDKPSVLVNILLSFL